MPENKLLKSVSVFAIDKVVEQDGVELDRGAGGSAERRAAEDGLSVERVLTFGTPA